MFGSLVVQILLYHYKFHVLIYYFKGNSKTCDPFLNLYFPTYYIPVYGLYVPNKLNLINVLFMQTLHTKKSFVSNYEIIR